jgi:hypothetical protein
MNWVLFGIVGALVLGIVGGLVMWTRFGANGGQD